MVRKNLNVRPRSFADSTRNNVNPGQVAHANPAENETRFQPAFGFDSEIPPNALGDCMALNAKRLRALGQLLHQFAAPLVEASRHGVVFPSWVVLSFGGEM